MAAMTPTGDSHIPDLLRRVLPENAHGPLVPDGLPNPLGRKAIFDFLVLGVPNPVSSQAMRPSSPALDRKAWLTAWTMASSFSWEKVRRTFCASSACFPNSPGFPAGKPNPDPW